MSLERFIVAQQHSYPSALKEIKAGKKTSHWMWYIFPQLKGLGHSEMATRYAICSLQEAKSYVEHQVLGKRLLEISNALLELKSNDASAIMGSPDDLKLRSSMSLFASLPQANPVFQKVLDQYFSGQKDDLTVSLLSN